MNVLITGGSKGIGKAIAEKFAGDKQGHGIILCARGRDTLEYAGRELQVRFPRASVQIRACDLSQKEELTDFADWVLANFENLDILVNNAGLFEPGSVHNEPEGALERMMEANLYSAYHLTRLLLPRMMQKKSGHIFNLCSIASLQAYPNGGAYSISKSALLGFSRNLREELKPYHIKVTAILAGAVYTDSWSRSGVDPERIMEAGDIAEMVYAASQLSPQACVEEITVRPQLGDL